MFIQVFRCNIDRSASPRYEPMLDTRRVENLGISEDVEGAAFKRRCVEQLELACRKA